MLPDSDEAQHAETQTKSVLEVGVPGQLCLSLVYLNVNVKNTHVQILNTAIRFGLCVSAVYRIYRLAGFSETNHNRFPFSFFCSSHNLFTQYADGYIIFGPRMKLVNYTTKIVFSHMFFTKVLKKIQP